MLKMLYVAVIICLATLSGCGCDIIDNKNNEETHILHGATSLFGAVNVQNQTYRALNVNGSLNANHVRIDEDLLVNGAMTADDVRVGGNLIVNGSSMVRNASVAQKTKVSGFLEATDSIFSEVEANSTEIVFKNSTVASMVIHKPSSSDDHKMQIVILDHTTVQKNITFEKAGGRVITRNGAVIEGNIIGGMEQKK